MVDVLYARASRVVLLTDRHIAYFYVRHYSASATEARFPAASSGTGTAGGGGYGGSAGFGGGVGGGGGYGGGGSGGGSTVRSATVRVKWYIPNELVDNIRGVEKTYRITIDYRKPLSVSQKTGKTQTGKKEELKNEKRIAWA